MIKLALGILKMFLNIISSIAMGFTFSYYWAWFLVPLGLPAIGLAHAIGIAMTTSVLFFAFMYHTAIGFATNSGYDKSNEKAMAWINPVLLSFLYIILLLPGYIVHLFM
jgi:hypothetical protein